MAEVTTTDNLSLPEIPGISERAKLYGIEEKDLLTILSYLCDFSAERAYSDYYGIDPDIPGSSAEALRYFQRPDIARIVARELALLGQVLALRKEAIIMRVWQEALNPKSKGSERIKALELVAKLIGAIDSKESGGAVPTVNVTINSSSPQQSIMEVEKIFPDGHKQSQELKISGDKMEVSDVIEQVESD